MGKTISQQQTGFLSTHAVGSGHKGTVWAAISSQTLMFGGCKPIHLGPGRAGGGSNYSRAVLEVSVGEGDNLGGGSGKRFWKSICLLLVLLFELLITAGNQTWEIVAQVQ